MFVAELAEAEALRRMVSTISAQAQYKKRAKLSFESAQVVYLRKNYCAPSTCMMHKTSNAQTAVAVATLHICVH
jgi:hypothetical protein